MFFFSRRARPRSTAPTKPGSLTRRWPSFSCSASSSEMEAEVLIIGVMRAARPAMGLRPGRSTSASQLSPERLSAGTRPARTKDDLPAPEGPTMARSGRSRTRLTVAAISSPRPKKRLASFSWKAARPA